MSNETVTRRSNWGWISIALITMLVLSFAAACGGGDNDDDATNDTTTTTETTGGATTEADAVATTDTSTSESTEASDDTSEIEATASAAIGDAATMTGLDSESLNAIGECFETNTTSDIVTELRDGNTEMAEGVYRECLEGELPEPLLLMAEPIIQTAAECGVTASEGLSDDEVAAMENGDEAVIERVSNDTIDCVSAEYGDLLS